jgi:flagellar hook-associated protein 1
LTDTSTGLSTSTLIPFGGSGSSVTDDTQFPGRQPQHVSGVQATISNGKLQISTTNPDTQITFSQDSSGVLAGLGINTFFSGTDAGRLR